ncbi:MAG: hypothetical protein CSA58_08385 [Micrococcales bacterium]|nr:MAG: hypothetical protein CSA58_08385 [Micrococcales bacterium]
MNVAVSGYLWSQQRSGAAIALGVLGAAIAVWCLSYAGTLLTTEPSWWVLWGDLQYLGIVLIAPAWLVFMLLWTRREEYVTGWTVALLLVEPFVLMALLLNPGTHDLVRSAPVTWDLADRPWATVSGPAFFVHFAYTVAILLAATVLFLHDLWRRSLVYREQVITFSAVAVLPFIVSVGYNLRLWRVDFTPLAFSVTLMVLAWGVVRHGLLKLTPIAYRRLVDVLTDAVLVLDVFDNVVTSNPAADSLLSKLPGERSGLRRRLPAVLGQVVKQDGNEEATLVLDGERRFWESQVSELPDADGRAGGRLVVLRDITARRRNELERTRILAEQARVAATLNRSLRPDTLPATPGVSFAAEFRPAGAGREMGGDFYDVYGTEDTWLFTLGDVSGKGAPAAAVTALSRYSLRALTTNRLLSPPKALQALNQQLLSGEDQEKYLTAAHGWCQVDGGTVRVRFVLGGHPQPILVPVHGEITPVGSPGTAIGLIEEIDLNAEDMVLAPGEALVFYTDGVTEARCGRDFFGERRLIHELDRVRGAAATRIARHVLEAVLEFQQSDPVDDMAILVVQAPGPVRSGRVVDPQKVTTA